MLKTGGGGTQYNRPYGDVLPMRVAEWASWYMNDPLEDTKFGIWMGQLFKIFPNSSQYWLKFRKNRMILLKIWPKIGPMGIWMDHLFLRIGICMGQLSNSAVAHPYQNQTWVPPGLKKARNCCNKPQLCKLHYLKDPNTFLVLCTES